MKWMLAFINILLPSSYTVKTSLPDKILAIKNLSHLVNFGFAIIFTYSVKKVHSIKLFWLHLTVVQKFG